MVGTGVVALDAGRLERPDGDEALPERELALLRALAEAGGAAVTTGALAAALGGGGTSRVQDTVRRLRARIEGDPARPRHVLAVRGVGYRLALPTPARTAFADPPGPALGVLELGTHRVDLDRRVVVEADGATSALPDTEFRVLALLASRDGAVVTRAELSRAVWGRHVAPRRALDTVVHRLRARFEDTPARPVHLRTVHGVGYRLDASRAAADPLPPSLDLLGRDAALREVEALLSPGAVVTLTGPPGVGKSALAAAVARRARRGGGEVRFVDLGALEDPSDDRIAARVEPSGDPSTRVARLARLGPLLLVFDDAEGARDGLVGLLTAWRGAIPAARVLVSSRRSLGLPGEQVFALPPLSVDDADALFVRRVREAGGAVEGREVVRRLVERLDGLPLSIEVVAARARVLGVRDLLDGVAGRPDLLGGGEGSLTASLRASIDDLPPELLDLLRACAAFPDGFSPDAVARVAEVPAVQAVDRLARLVDRSLVISAPDPSSPGRRVLRLLRSVRGVVADHAGPARMDLLRDRHARHFAHLAVTLPAQEATTGLVGPRLAACRADLEQAFDRCVGSDVEAAARLLMVLCDLAAREGEVDYARPRVRALLDDPRLDAPDLRAGLVAAEAWEHLGRRRYDEAAAAFGRARSSIGGAPAAHLRLWEGVALLRAGRLDAADDGFEAVLSAADASALDRGMARAARVTLTSARGRYAEVVRDGPGVLSALRAGGHEITASTLAVTVAEAELHLSRPARARLHLDRARAPLVEGGYRAHLARLDLLLALAVWEGGDRSGGLAHLQSALVALERWGSAVLYDEGRLLHGVLLARGGDLDAGADLIRSHLTDDVAPWLAVAAHGVLAACASAVGALGAARDHKALAAEAARTDAERDAVALLQSAIGGDPRPSLPVTGLAARSLADVLRVSGPGRRDPSEPQQL